MTPWLPKFTTPEIGLIAAAIAIPALLVLYFLKLRRREVAVSSTLLWKKAVQDLQVNAPFQRLRKNLLLLLQLLLLALLCMALTRPVMNMKRGAGKLTVILIDRSASMAVKDADGNRTRLEQAKRRAREIVDSMTRNDNACVIAFDDAAETLCPLTPDAGRLRAAIDSIEQTDRPTRLKLAYQLAEAQASYIPEQNRENVKPDVFLFSDGRTLDYDSLTLRGNLIFEKIGRDDTRNIAIVALSAKRNYERPTDVQVFARLANFGPDPVEADVNLMVATEFNPGPSFSISRSAHTYLYPERWSAEQREIHAKTGKLAQDSVEFKLELTGNAVIRLEQMNKKNDALAADDVAQVVVPPPKAQTLLLVTKGNYYLERLRGTMQSVKEFDILTPAGYEEQKPARYDVVIFDNHSPTFLPKAGNFMYFNALPPGSRVKHAHDGPVPQFTRGNNILDWKRDHPILRGLNLGKRYIEDAMKLDVPLGAQRLVEGTRGPLIVLNRDGRSTHLIVGFKLLDSDWPLKMSFPVFMYNAVQYLTLGAQMDQKEALSPGATPTIPQADIRRALPAADKVGLFGPGNPRDVHIPDAGDFALPPLDHVGLYLLGASVPGYDRFAVNLLDSSESNLAPVTQPPGGVGETTASSGKSRVELWWWLALAALPLLLVEWWIYTRRVHL